MIAFWSFGLTLCWLILCFDLLVGAFMIQAGQITVGGNYYLFGHAGLASGHWLLCIHRKCNHQRIENLLEQESDVQDPAHPLPSIENGRLEYAIDRFAFEDEILEIFISPWETLGLVGQTGSGKTAALKLLLREHDVNQGAIYLNGHNIRDYRLSDLRSWWAMFLKTSFSLPAPFGQYLLWQYLPVTYLLWQGRRSD